MHTKGPWVVGTSVDNGIHCVDGMNNDGGVIEICEVWGTLNDKEPDDASYANAILIAAAPDLLEALELAEYVIAEVCFDQHPDNVCCHTLGAVRAAIAKAKGTTYA